MQSKRWMMWMAVGLVAAVAMGSGCKKKTAGSGTGPASHRRTRIRPDRSGG